MKISKISISNFRCFSSFELNLHDKITVLIASNGTGKTTILDALRIAVWPFVKAFDLGSQTGKSATIQIEDVRLIKNKSNMEPQLPSLISCEAAWSEDDNSRVSWTQSREKTKKRTNTLGDKETKDLFKFGKKLQDDVRNETSKDIVLPLVVYLGTGRLWYQGRYTSDVSEKTLDKSIHSRLWGYQNCLTATSSYKQFEDWYAWVFKGYKEQVIAKNDEIISFDVEAYNSFRCAVIVVQKAVNELTEEVTGWKNLQYQESQQALVMEHPEEGVLPLSLLSDGLRNMIIMVCDLAFRCYKLNPDYKEEAALLTPGIAMIDEVDMFLHPAWQQRILDSLQAAFPKIQFIVTTHSPQVLTTVDAQCIRLLSKDENGDIRVSSSFPEIKGIGSNVALYEIMGVNPTPPNAEAKWISDYVAMVEDGSFNDAEGIELRALLIEKYGVNHPAILYADKLIRFKEFKKKLS